MAGQKGKLDSLALGSGLTRGVARAETRACSAGTGLDLTVGTELACSQRGLLGRGASQREDKNEPSTGLGRGQAGAPGTDDVA